MVEANHLTLYERLGESLSATEGIRPGGLELTERALSFCRFAPGSSILDIGCGNGVTAEFIERVFGLRAVGVDSSVVQLREARRRNSSVCVIRASGTNLPFSRDRFDGAILECVLSLIQDHRAALDECNRILKPGGRIVLSDVYARKPEGIPRLRDLPLRCCLGGATSLDELKECVVSAGFDIELVEDHSDRLKDFAVQMVWRFGSMSGFWRLAGGGAENFDGIGESIREARPGYCLIIGRKSAQE